MLFSNFVTDLSANSARVSACNDSICFGQHQDVSDFHRENEKLGIKMGLKLLVSQSVSQSLQGGVAAHTAGNSGTTSEYSRGGASQLWNDKALSCSIKTNAFTIQVPLPKTFTTLPPSACQRGPWSLPHTCLPSESTVIRKNVPDVRPQLTLYSCLPIQRKCQPSKQMLGISQEVTEPLRSNGIRQCSLCFPAYCFTWDENKITSTWHLV